MESQPRIVLYRDNYENVRQILTQSQKGDLLDALMDGDEYQGDDQLVRMAFNIFEAAIRRTEEKYQEYCEKNRQNALHRWEKERQKQADTSGYERIPDDTSHTNTHSRSHPRKRDISFVPPTVDEVRAYCQERGNDIDAEYFVDYYARIGWELKPGQKMKDWKATIRTWEQKRKEWKKDELQRAGNGDRVRGQRDLYGL